MVANLGSGDVGFERLGLESCVKGKGQSGKTVCLRAKVGINQQLKVGKG